MPLAVSREPTLGSVCSARSPSPAGSAKEVSGLVLDGEGPSLLSWSWREVGRCGGGSSLQTPRSLWLLGRGQILGTLCSKGKDSFPGRMGRDFSSARGPREDLRTEPCWTMWTLGARSRLSLHDARPLPHLARQPPAPHHPAVVPKLIYGGRRGSPPRRSSQTRGRVFQAPADVFFPSRCPLSDGSLWL